MAGALVYGSWLGAIAADTPLRAPRSLARPENVLTVLVGSPGDMETTGRSPLVHIRVCIKYTQRCSQQRAAGQLRASCDSSSFQWRPWSISRKKPNESSQFQIVFKLSAFHRQAEIITMGCSVAMGPAYDIWNLACWWTWVWNW